MNNSVSASDNWRIYAFILLLLYVLIYLLPLGLRPLMIPDEVRYAEIPREMIASGQWVSPSLNGLRYFEKPVMGYWVVAASMKLFGENAFAVRLPSALSAGISALAIFLLMSYSRYSTKTALTAAMIYLTMFGVFLMGSYNVLDSVFSLLLTLAFVAFYFSHREQDQRKRIFELILMGVFTGAAFLTKGFLAFALLGIVIVPYVIWQRRWKELFSRGWQPTLVALMVILPWAIMINLQQPDFWHYFFWQENIKRFASDNAQHQEPFWFYLLFLPLLAWPWVTQLGTAIKGLWQTRQRDNEEKMFVQYMLLWLLLPFILFSIARGKLPTYILPCLAPLAILFAIGLENYLTGQSIRQKKRWFTAGAWLSASVLVAITLFIVLIQNGVIAKRIWYENESWKWLLLCVTFVFAAAIIAYSSRIQTGAGKVLSFYAVSLVPIMLATQFILPEQTAESKMPGKFLQQNAYKVSPDTLLVADNNLIHAVNWYFHRSDVYMTAPGELSYGLSYADSKYRLLQGDKFKQFLAHNINKKPIVIVQHSDGSQKMKAMLPPQATVVRWGRFVLWTIPVEKTKS